MSSSASVVPTAPSLDRCNLSSIMEYLDSKIPRGAFIKTVSGVISVAVAALASSSSPSEISFADSFNDPVEVLNMTDKEMFEKAENSPLLSPSYFPKEEQESAQVVQKMLQNPLKETSEDFTYFKSRLKAHAELVLADRLVNIRSILTQSFSSPHSGAVFTLKSISVLYQQGDDTTELSF